MSAAGSLHIANVDEQDNGRYECTVLNDFGRATASAVVSVRFVVIKKFNKFFQNTQLNSIMFSINFYRKRDELAPGDKFVRIAFSEASKEVDLAINQTILTLFSNNSASKKHHSDLFKIVRFPTGPARGLKIEL